MGKFLSVLLVVFWLGFSGLQVQAPSLYQISIGDWWETALSSFVESHKDDAMLADLEGSELADALQGLGWYEDSFLDTSLFLSTNKEAVPYAAPVSPTIPIYTAQVQGISWWMPVSIEIEVQGLDEWFEVRWANALLNSNVEVDVVYWQESANNKGYGKYGGRLLGEVGEGSFSPLNCGPVASYVNPSQPTQINRQGGSLTLPPSTIPRLIRISIIRRPDLEVLIPIHLSHLDVGVKVWQGYIW